MARLVLHLGEQDRLALQRRRAGDPVALGQLADDLGMGVLADLADQRLAVALGHPLLGLDLLAAVDALLEGALLRQSSRRASSGRRSGPAGRTFGFLLSDAFDDGGDALSHADAHGAERVAAAAAVQLVHGGRDQPRAGHAERVAERDGAAVRVYMRRVVGQAKVAQHGERLGGEGLVELDHVHLVDA